MNKIIGLKELRSNMDMYISEVNKGKSFVIVKKSKPVFRVAPINDEDGMWETVTDFTKIKRGGVSVDEILKRL